MNRQVKAALADVESLLAKQKPSATVSASARRKKIVAMLWGGSRPNLRRLNRLIARGIIAPGEVVDAVGEALILRRVNRRIVEAITNALKDALMDDASAEVVDVSAA